MRNVRVLVPSCILWACLAPVPSIAGADAGDPKEGETKSATCAACHGPNGQSVNPIWPSLAGQGAEYIAKQLHNFKDGENGGRNNPIMYAQVAALSDQDVADLAAYFSKLEPAKGQADEALLEVGRNLYRGGDVERSIPACAGCHGPRGRGNPAARYPRLAGQQADYTAAQLQTFAGGQRANDPNEMMRSVAGKLKPDEMAALASYIQGLR